MLYMMVHEWYPMFIIHYVMFYYSKLAILKLPFFDVTDLSITSKSPLSLPNNLYFEFFSSFRLIPTLTFCCLRKSLVGLWKGFFNQKRCRRKPLEVVLVATVFCILFNINKHNKQTLVLYCLDLLLCCKEMVCILVYIFILQLCCIYRDFSRSSVEKTFRK